MPSEPAVVIQPRDGGRHIVTTAREMRRLAFWASVGLRAQQERERDFPVIDQQALALATSIREALS